MMGIGYNIILLYVVVVYCHVCKQWHNQRGGGGSRGSCRPPTSREPELHCILLLHNFTVHGRRNRLRCIWTLQCQTNGYLSSLCW